MTDIVIALPELWVALMACAVLLACVLGRDPETPYLLSQVTLAVALLLVLWLYPGEPELAFNEMFVNDRMATVLKAVILAVTAGVFVYSRTYLAARALFNGEYFVLGLFAVLGMLILVSAHSLLTIYLGLELLSLSLYAMVAMHRDSHAASEAAMKYFVLGALASGMMLYGISILYGVTGTLDLQQLAATLQDAERSLLPVFGLVFLIVGIAFKLGAVPFHMWIPDVYEGAPTSVTLFLTTAPKLSGFALAMRLLVEGLPGLSADWQQMLAVLAVLSMGTGNIVAIAQSNIKRMLAYSTIAHMGFMLLGLLAATQAGYAGSMFYVIVYALMGMGAFGMVIALGRAGFESDRLEDFKGLSERSPWLALLMLMLIFSLAGVPPFVGFWAKWFVIKEALAAGFVSLAVIAVVFSIIGAYYYLRIVKLMYFDDPEDTSPVVCGQDTRAVLSFNGLAVLALGLMPGVLMTLCLAAMSGASSS
ncbi:MAG: NADH-quinone oxidoreductase subunit NuoN [Gammaproteobacteria bacterium]